MNATHLILLFSFLALNGCSGQPIPEGFHYDISAAKKINKLPNELLEVSGLAFYSNQKVYCVQDEKGIVFIYNLKKNSISKEISFGKDNDFEGVAKAGKVLYAMKSNGTLYRIKHPGNQKKMKVKKITTFLNEEYDCEGICYDEKNKQLLIVCKDRPSEKKTTRHIFRFDLKTQKLKEKPYFKIKIDEVNAVRNTEKKIKAFNPSGVAIHPISNDIYVLSSQGNTLIVINEKKEITHAVHLKETLFKQPEGITFDLEGTMYISNEGHGQKATIKSFKYINN